MGIWKICVNEAKLYRQFFSAKLDMLNVYQNLITFLCYFGNGIYNRGKAAEKLAFSLKILAVFQ